MAGESSGPFDDARFQEIARDVELEQTRTRIQKFGTLVGSYYKGLLESGIPPQSACAMAYEWQRLQVIHDLWPASSLE